MKNLITIFILTITSSAFAQQLNWSSTNEDTKSLTYLNFGYDFGVTTQVGYAHKLDVFRPMILTADYSFPMGKTIIDDFKFRIGGQLSIVERNNFVASAKLYGILRRHQTNLVRIANVGAEAAVMLGYYKDKWHIAAEFGLDKAISSHLKHTELFQENYADVSDGWFVPTAGNFYYGIQASRTLGNKMELSIRIGATDAESTTADALLPYYAQLGLNYKFSSSAIN